MHTLVFASQKGGSGKTTLSGHLAVEAERAGAGPVALIDTDPQGSLAAWWNARESRTPVFVQVESMELEEALSELHSAGIQLAIVDTPPAITGAISKVVSCADLVVVPTRPGPHDLRAVGATVDIAENLEKPLVFVVNGATARARITSDATMALSQHGTVAPITLHHRVDFAASMVDGRTVGEVVANSKSAEEIKLLWSYLAEKLGQFPKTSDFAIEISRPTLAPVQPSFVVADELDNAGEEVPAVPQTNGGEKLQPKKDIDTVPLNGVEPPAVKVMNGKFGQVERRSTSTFGRRRSQGTV